MHGSRNPEHSSEPFDDLDTAAFDYAERWTRADTELRTRLRADLICNCLPFADRLARRYRRGSEPLEDLQQVARLGLIKAIDRYDPGRGSFTAFAIITICGEIKRHFRDKTWGLHVARRLQDLALEVRHATVVLTTILARVPSNAELAHYLNLTPDEVRHALECAACHSPLPLSTPIGADGTRELSDVVGGRDRLVEAVPDKVTVAELIHVLPARVQQMIALRFYGDRTQAQIATELGISQMHVSRLLQQAMTWLRAAMLNDVAPPWTGTDDCRPDNLRVRTNQTAGAVTVTVCGEVDRDTANRLRLRLRSAVAKASGGSVIIDVAGMPLMDAAGAAVLRDAHVAAALAHITITMTGANPHVAAVLATAGLPSAPRPAARSPRPRPRPVHPR